MLNRLRKAVGLRGAVHDGGPGDSSAAAEDLTTDQRYGVEALEPRLLLSADPFTGEVVRLAADALEAHETPPALVLEAPEAAPADEAPAEPDGAEDDRIAWPESWSDPSDASVGTAAREAVVVTVDPSSGPIELFAFVHALALAAETGPAAIVALMKGFGLETSHLDDDRTVVPEPAGGPPASSEGGRHAEPRTASEEPGRERDGLMATTAAASPERSAASGSAAFESDAPIATTAPAADAPALEDGTAPPRRRLRDPRGPRDAGGRDRRRADLRSAALRRA